MLFDDTDEPFTSLVDMELPWQALNALDTFFEEGELGNIEVELSESVWLRNASLISIGEGTVIEPGALIEGPCVIGKGCHIGHGAYLRAGNLIGDGCVIGHASEVKHSIFMPGARAPHFNYVGDSILGRDVNLGAGVKCANYRVDGKEVIVQWNGKAIGSGRVKLGAIVGDRVHIGCNTVLNPGVIVESDYLYAGGKNLKGYVKRRIAALR